MKDIPIHFIHCSTRSGSTMLVQMLNQSENVISTSEEQFVIEFHNKYKNKIKWSSKEIKSFIDEFWHLSKKNPEFFFISKDELERRLLETSDDLPFWKLIRIIYCSYFPFMEKKNITTIIDKQIWYVYQWKRLKAITPHSRHLILVRNFKDYLASVKKRKMEEFGTLSSQAYVWAIAYRKLYKIINKNPQRTMILHYEDLVKTPAVELKKVCLFFNISYSDEMLKFYKSHKKQIEALSFDTKEFKFYETILSGLKSPINNKSIGVHYSLLSKKEIYISEKICNSIAEKFDYKTNSNSFFMIRPIDFIKVYYQQIIKSKLYYYFPIWLKLKLRKKK